jgi:hypothetical protein
MPQRLINLAEYWMPKFVVLGVALGTFFAPLTHILIFTGFAIALDFVTGYWASKKRGERFNSRKAQRSWAKVILYPLGFIFSQGAEYLAPEVPFVKGALYLLIIIEGKSLEENFSEILGYSLMKYIKAFMMKGRAGMIAELNKDKDEH